MTSLKKRILITLCIQLHLWIFSLSAQSLPQRIAYDIPGESIWYVNHTATLDGGYIMVGGIYDTTQSSVMEWASMAFVKLDHAGNVQWMTQIDSLGFGFGTKNVVQSPDSSYFCCFTDSDYSAFYRAIKLDQHGVVIFNNRISLPQQTTQIFPPFSLASNDGTYLLSGWFSDSAWVGSEYITQLSSTGTVMWSKTYSVGWAAFYDPQVDTFSNGDILLFSAGSLAPFTPVGVRISRLDAAGNHLWTKVLCDTFSYHSTSFQVLDNDKIMFMGKAYSPQIGFREITLTLCDDTAGVIWAKRWGNQMYHLESVEMMFDSAGISVIGTTDIYEGYQARFDTLGNTLWIRKYPGTQMVSIEQYGDSGFSILCGRLGELEMMKVGWNGIGCESTLMPLSIHPFDPVPYDLPMNVDTISITSIPQVLFTSMHTVVQSDVCSLIGISENEAVPQTEIYPVPADNFLQLRSEDVSVSVDIINVQGQTVLSAVNQSGNCSLNVAALPDGIYFVIISGEERIESHKIIIMHPE